jgi:NTP pyrophosphatase (non-canonical NTP hydrolase)
MDREKFIEGMSSDLELSEEMRVDIFTRSLYSCDWQTKCIIIMEELAELQQVVSKCARGEYDKYALLEEMADVIICLNYLQEHYDLQPCEIDKAVDVKLERITREKLSVL